ncbi:LCP family glycopolymer transferase [Lapidilactobacillus bayanensis]|uniref:LCP family glycopolymer transferase n=1 Tax=Lapidilactobacillus bayanensis TaxID=2485998 RepID=UPI000F78A220|nr:LCP family protein [Lapidilactobacillus bayanensis]
MERQQRRKLRRNESLAVLLKKETKHPGARLFGLIMVAVLFVFGAYVLRLYGQTKSAIDSTFQSAGNVKSATVFRDKKPFSLLLLGADTGALGRTTQGNSDTMIIVTVNPKTNKTVLTSVPRDTMAQIIGMQEFTVEKINAAYMHGGSKMALDTVDKLLNVPIDYYVTVNMGGLEKVVNAVGGVDVKVPFSFSYDGSTFKKGQQHLNGKQALAFARMRYQDPNNDYGRQLRQRQIITGVIKAAMSTGTLANFKDVLTSVSENMKTNLTFNDMVTIFQNYRAAGKTVKSDHIQGVNATIKGSSYQIAPTSELQRVSDKIRTELGLKQKKLTNEEARQNKLNANQGFVFDNPTVDQYFTIFPQYQGE